MFFNEPFPSYTDEVYETASEGHSDQLSLIQEEPTAVEQTVLAENSHALDGVRFRAYGGIWVRVSYAFRFCNRHGQGRKKVQNVAPTRISPFMYVVFS